MAGYSGTPLIKKLGFNAPLSLLAINPPRDYAGWLGALPEGVRIISKTKKPIRAAHVFVTRRGDLEKKLVACRKQLEQNGFVGIVAQESIEGPN